MRVEEAMAAQQVGTSVALAALDPEGPACHHMLAGGALLYGGPGMYVNRGIGLGLRAPVTADHLDAIEAFYDGAGAPAELELNPFALDLDGLLGAVAACGWSLTSLRPTFLLGLDGPPGPVPPSGPDLRFRTVVDDASLAVWQEVLATGFAQHDGAARAVSDRFSAGAHRAPGAVDLVIEVAGKPAGACSVTIADGVAWLGGMAVLPEHRGRGLQRNALGHRVALAVAAGCDVAAVGALQGGTSFRNVQRAGFAMAWTNAVLRRPHPVSS